MKKNLSYLNKPILILTIIFLSFGLLMIQSASSMESYMRYGNSPYHYFIKQLIIVVASLIPFFIIINIKTKMYQKWYQILMVLSILSLLALIIYGYAANHAKSWFSLGFFSLQPSELVKVVIIIYLACYYEKNKDNLNSMSVLVKPLIPIIIIFAIVAIQPDLGTGSIIVMLSLLIYYVVPMSPYCKKKTNIMLASSILLVLIILLIMGGDLLKGYQLDRFNFLNPCDRYQEDSGYQLCNSFIAFNNGGLTGQGIGESTQKYLYLPEAYTDFIFPIIVEEWGLIVGIIIIVFYAILLLLIYQVAKKAKTLRDSLIAYGVMIYILLHILVNLMGVMGIMPLTGVPLPFLSYGGSYVISLIMALGLVQRVNIETKRIDNRQK